MAQGPRILLSQRQNLTSFDGEAVIGQFVGAVRSAARLAVSSAPTDEAVENCALPGGACYLLASPDDLLDALVAQAQFLSYVPHRCSRGVEAPNCLVEVEAPSLRFELKLVQLITSELRFQPQRVVHAVYDSSREMRCLVQ
jgi:hypothetical protein